jgi:hypothetical protein
VGRPARIQPGRVNSQPDRPLLSLSLPLRHESPGTPHGAALPLLFPGCSRASPALVRWDLDLLVVINNPLWLDLILLASRACPRPRNPSYSRADSAAAGLLRRSPALPLGFPDRPTTSAWCGPAQVVPWRHLCRHCRRPPPPPRNAAAHTQWAAPLSLSPSGSMRCLMLVTGYAWWCFACGIYVNSPVKLWCHVMVLWCAKFDCGVLRLASCYNSIKMLNWIWFSEMLLSSYLAPVVPPGEYA